MTASELDLAYRLALSRVRQSGYSFESVRLYYRGCDEYKIEYRRNTT